MIYSSPVTATPNQDSKKEPLNILERLGEQLQPIKITGKTIGLHCIELVIITRGYRTRSGPKCYLGPELITDLLAWSEPIPVSYSAGSDSFESLFSVIWSEMLTTIKQELVQGTEWVLHVPNFWLLLERFSFLKHFHWKRIHCVRPIWNIWLISQNIIWPSDNGYFIIIFVPCLN